jgi:hypothetical protein
MASRSASPVPSWCPSACPRGEGLSGAAADCAPRGLCRRCGSPYPHVQGAAGSSAAGSGLVGPPASAGHPRERSWPKPFHRPIPPVLAAHRPRVGWRATPRPTVDPSAELGRSLVGHGGADVGSAPSPVCGRGPLVRRPAARKPSEGSRRRGSLVLAVLRGADRGPTSARARRGRAPCMRRRAEPRPPAAASWVSLGGRPHVIRAPAASALARDAERPSNPCTRLRCARR